MSAGNRPLFEPLVTQFYGITRPQWVYISIRNISSVAKVPLQNLSNQIHSSAVKTSVKYEHDFYQASSVNFCSINDWIRSQPMRKDVTYVTSSLIRWDLARPLIENRPKWMSAAVHISRVMLNAQVTHQMRLSWACFAEKYVTKWRVM